MEAMRQSWSDDRLDVLNRRVGEGFDLVDRKFELVDRRFAQVDQRFAQLDQRLDQIDDRLGRVEGRLDKLDGGIDRINENLMALHQSHSQFAMTITVAITIGFLGTITAHLFAAG
jgi:septal ring factor EnvC (AmiA/AmiB activator)